MLSHDLAYPIFRCDRCGSSTEGVRKRYAVAQRLNVGRLRLEIDNCEGESIDELTGRHLCDHSAGSDALSAGNRLRTISRQSRTPKLSWITELDDGVDPHQFSTNLDPCSNGIDFGKYARGERSLREHQYYAHPQNAFWKVMGQITGIDPLAAYADRIRQMNEAGIALWDVIRCCDRPGSLDGDILKNSIEPNDFVRFFREHPLIKLVCFNGATAAESFHRHVLPTLGSLDLKYLRMPSTSPAHTMSVANKLDAWSAISEYRQFTTLTLTSPSSESRIPRFQ